MEEKKSYENITDEDEDDYINLA